MFIDRVKYYTKIAMSSSGCFRSRENEKQNLIIFRKEGGKI